MTLDEAIKENIDDLKFYIEEYEKALNDKNFARVYYGINGGWSANGDVAAAFTALLFKNNINPLEYMDKVPTVFACSLNIKEITIPNNINIIGWSAFADCEDLKSIHIPKSVISINELAFDNCYNLTDIYYEGSKEDWDKIEIEENNEPLFDANIHYNS